jgi:WD40 repeat protein/serine/threonine protein kinase
MTPEGLKQVEEIFQAALELGPHQRTAFLANACGDDEALRYEVESLLDYKERTQSPLKYPVADDAFRALAQRDGESLIGKTVGHFKLLSRIGEGGMGQVYAALDQRLNRKVALKFLPASFLEDKDQVLRLHHEARAASALNHPNIVTIYDLGQADSLHFIAMEFVEGTTLRQKTQGQMPFHKVLNVAIQVASGLAAAHQAGVLHRDIKPENVMFGRDGFVKILDFGIAKFKEQQVMSSHPQSETASADNAYVSVAAGTLSYMSPEQARREQLDARTDIFSLGIVLFELVAGRRPFGGETLTEMLRAILNDEAPPLSAIRRNLPPDLERIIGKALKKNRDERYQSAREMLADLKEFNEGTDGALDARERANRMLVQYLSIYAVDKRALIPIMKLPFIRRYSDLERGERTRELLKKSLRSGLIKTSLMLISLLLVTTLGAAALSRSEEWDAQRLSDGHTAAVRQAAFSPDGRWLVSAGEDAKVIVWDFAARMPVATLTDHTKTVTSVDFSPDGKWFATGSEDHTVIVWDAARREKVAVLFGPPAMVIAVAFSPDGRLLASAAHESMDNRGQIILWEVGSWKKVREITAAVNPYGRLMFSRDSVSLISNYPEEFNVVTGQHIKPDFDAGLNWFALSPDAAHIVMMGGGGAVRMRDLIHHRTATYEDAHQDSGRAAAFSPDGRFVATGADDIVLWDAKTLTNIGRLEYPSIVWNVAFSPDSKWLISTHGDGAILIWDVEARKRIANLNEHSEPVRGVAFSPDGKLIASAGEDRAVIIWNAESGRKEAVLLGPPSRLTAVAFASDGKHIAAAEFNHALNLWDRSQPRKQLTINIGSASYCVAISPDGRSIATTDGVYSSTDNHQLVDFEKEITGRQVYGVAFSSDGRWLACVSPFRLIALFDTGNWKLRDKVEGSDTRLVTVSFSRDNKHLVTGDDDGRVRLWEIEPLREIALLGRHTSRVKSVAFSPDGSEVASAGDDRQINLWDVSRRRLITSIGTHTAPVLSVAFSPDGKKLVAGGHDNSVRIFTRRRTLWGYRLD